MLLRMELPYFLEKEVENITSDPFLIHVDYYYRSAEIFILYCLRSLEAYEVDNPTNLILQAFQLYY